MLSKISWSQFGTVVLAVLVVYYVFVLGKCYRKEIAGIFSGKKRAPKAAGAAAGGAATAGASASASASAPVEAKDQVPELYKVMEKVIAQLKGVMDEGMVSRAGREELTDHIRGVLSGYRQLKKTPYQVSINNYLVRVCSAQFALSLDEGQLEALWG
jgi:hypothetical protein